MSFILVYESSYRIEKTWNLTQSDTVDHPVVLLGWHLFYFCISGVKDSVSKVFNEWGASFGVLIVASEIQCIYFSIIILFSHLSHKKKISKEKLLWSKYLKSQKNFKFEFNSLFSILLSAILKRLFKMGYKGIFWMLNINEQFCRYSARLCRQDTHNQSIE